jgi:hypothetical protein
MRTEIGDELMEPEIHLVTSENLIPVAKFIRQVYDYTHSGVREKIDHLEAEMMKLPQLEIPPVHYFAKGLYAREIFIPAGTLLTGKIHKTEHLNIVSKGDISVVTESGIKRIVAPLTMVSQPGTKRVGYAHADTVWTTIHPNISNERDLDKLEEELIALSYDAVFDVLDGKEEIKCLG